MPELTIRNVDQDDMSAITDIYRDAVLHGTASFELDPPEESEMTSRMLNIVEAGYPYIVGISEEGAVMGYAYASAYRARPAYRWSCENSVYIDKSAHGAGIGKKLMQVIIERCTALGFRQMLGIVGGSEHMASIGLHKSLGFEHVGTLPATGYKHGRWLDSVLMQRALGEGDKSKPDPTTFPGTLYKPGS